MGGALSEDVHAALAALAATLSHLPADDPATLTDGAAGRALFFHHLDLALPGRGHDGTAARLLDHAFARSAELPLGPALFGGFVGVAWVAQHLGQGDDDIDALLVDRLEGQPVFEQFDLVYGLAGLGVYALERLPRPGARRLLAAIVERLAELAEPRPVGLTWRTHPWLLLPDARAKHPRGYDDLGVAHGAPAVALLLAGACAHGVAAERARPLLHGVIAWILDHRRDHALPYVAGDGTAWSAARPAWCYGAPGVAAMLLAVAHALHEPAWAEAALAMARHDAARALAAVDATDAGLCHGTAGLAHLYHRMWRASDDPLLRDTALALVAATLAKRAPGRGVGGLRTVGPDGAPRDDAGFLTGGCGVGLALLAAVSAAEPTWDRALAVSLPQ